MNYKISHFKIWVYIYIYIMILCRENSEAIQLITWNQTLVKATSLWVIILSSKINVKRRKDTLCFPLSQRDQIRSAWIKWHLLNLQLIFKSRRLVLVRTCIHREPNACNLRLACGHHSHACVNSVLILPEILC